MKWRHWSILIVLVLLNYIIFSTAFTLLAEQRRPGPLPTRTPQPTFQSIEPTPIAWIVLPTNTSRPPRPKVTPTAAITSAVAVTTTTEIPPTETVIPATASVTPIPPTATPSATAEQTTITHVVQQGETLSQIAAQYQVSVQAIMEANGLTDPDLIVVGQELIIPTSGQELPTATRPPGPTNTPRPPATRTPAPTSGPQFTGELIWDKTIAPNCSGPAISKMSVIRDTSGNPVNGVRVQVECYGNVWYSHPSGNPGEYEPGHYDFAFGQLNPVDWVCTAQVYDINGQRVESSAVVTISFDTNDCQPNGNGHQVALVNWTKRW